MWWVAHHGFAQPRGVSEIERTMSHNPDGANRGEGCVKMVYWNFKISYVFSGAAIYPKSVSGRILLVFWWLFTIIMVATYTANLAAYLTITLTRKPVNSLEELAQSTDITPLIQSSTHLQTLFEVMIFLK